jgi:hypothetical protein
MSEIAADSSLEEFGPDAHVLTGAIEQITHLLRQHVDAYSDLQRYLTPVRFRSHTMAIRTDVIHENQPREPSRSGPPMQIKEQLGMVAQLLKQLSAERAGAIQASQEAIAQLQAENDRLHTELTEYRRREFDEIMPSQSGDDGLESVTNSVPGTPLARGRRSMRTLRESVTPEFFPGFQARAQFSPWPGSA